MSTDPLPGRTPSPSFWERRGGAEGALWGAGPREGVRACLGARLGSLPCSGSPALLRAKNSFGAEEEFETPRVNSTKTRTIEE